MKCAVLLASFNGSRYIIEQILSISNQIDVKIDLFISDDGSSDSTLAKIREIAASIDLTIVIVKLHTNVFSTGASNNFYRLITQVDYSSYDWVALSDQDDIWKATKISRAISVLSSGGYSGYSSSIEEFDDDITNTRLIRKNYPRSAYNCIFESPGPGCTFVLPVAAMLRVKTLLERHSTLVAKVKYHDWLIYALVVINVGPWFIDSYPGLLYRQHDANVLGSNKSLVAKFRRLSLFFGSFYIDQVKLIIEILQLNENPGFSCVYGKTFVQRVLFSKLLFFSRSKLSHKIIAIFLPFFH